MSVELGKFVTTYLADTKDYVRKIKELDSLTKKVVSSVKKQLASLDKSFNKSMRNNTTALNNLEKKFKRSIKEINNLKIDPKKSNITNTLVKSLEKAIKPKIEISGVTAPKEALNKASSDFSDVVSGALASTIGNSLSSVFPKIAKSLTSTLGRVFKNPKLVYPLLQGLLKLPWKLIAANFKKVMLAAIGGIKAALLSPITWTVLVSLKIVNSYTKDDKAIQESIKQQEEANAALLDKKFDLISQTNKELLETKDLVKLEERRLQQASQLEDVNKRIVDTQNKLKNQSKDGKDKALDAGVWINNALSNIGLTNRISMSASDQDTDSLLKTYREANKEFTKLQEINDDFLKQLDEIENELASTFNIKFDKDSQLDTFYSKISELDILLKKGKVTNETYVRSLLEGLGDINGMSKITLEDLEKVSNFLYRDSQGLPPLDFSDPKMLEKVKETLLSPEGLQKNEKFLASIQENLETIKEFEDAVKKLNSSLEKSNEDINPVDEFQSLKDKLPQGSEQLNQIEILQKELELSEKQKEIREQISKLTKDGNESIEKALSDIQEPLTDIEKFLQENKSLLSTEDFKQLEILNETVKSEEKLRDLRKEANELLEKAATPQEQYLENLKRITEMVEEGVLTNPEDVNKLTKYLQETYEKEAGVDSEKPLSGDDKVSIAEGGMADSESVVNRLLALSSERPDTEEKKQTEQLVDINSELYKLNRALADKIQPATIGILSRN